MRKLRDRAYHVANDAAILHCGAGSKRCSKIEAVPGPASFRGRVKNVAKEIEVWAWWDILTRTAFFPARHEHIYIRTL